MLWSIHQRWLLSTGRQQRRRLVLVCQGCCSSRRTPRRNGIYRHHGTSSATNHENHRHHHQLFWSPQVVFGSPDHDNMQVAAGSVQVCSSSGRIVDCRPGENRAQAQQRAQHQQQRQQQRHAMKFVDLSSTSSDSNKKHNNVCLSPGLIDVHAHISQLGRNWEGYTTATLAAAAGGITTIVGMPLNSIPATTTVQAVEQELEAAHQKQQQQQHTDDSMLYVNVGLWGGVVPENCNATDLTALLSHSHVLGLKAFLSPLPPAAGYQAVTPEQLLQAARICGRFQKPILVHAELMTTAEMEDALQGAYATNKNASSSSSYSSHVASRPPEWEQRAVKAVIQAAQYCDMHIVHLSDGLGCLPLIEQAKKQQSTSNSSSSNSNNNKHRRLTVETCPHYLLLDCDSIPDDETRVKCVPPIRHAAQRERLWQGLADHTIDLIGSDHSPCEPFLRRQPLAQAWAGLSGLQYQLPATWTAAYEQGFGVKEMALWWSLNPAKLARLEQDRGSIEVGKLADLVWWDVDHVGVPNDYVREYHRWKGDCYFAEMLLRGCILGTRVAGSQVYNGIADGHGDAAGVYLHQKEQPERTAVV